MTKIPDETKQMSLKRAAFINGAAKYSVIIMNLLFTSIMARLLTPEDYGVIAIVTIFTTLFARICDMGFGSAIIQFRDLSDEDIYHIFTFTGALAVFLAVIFGLLGKPIAFFYQNKEYEKLCVILSISIFFNCLNMIPNAVLMRDKRFAQVGIRTVVVNIVGYMAAIICACLGGKYYSLVLQSVVASVVCFFWNNHTVRLKFKVKLKLEPLKRVWNYSFFQFMFGWINYLETNLDNILVGGYMGSTALAYYDKGYKLISYPANNISDVVTPVLHPILKDFQENRKYIFKRYVGIQKILSKISVVVALIFICCSSEIIIIVFGNQWTASTMTLQLLSMSMYPKIMMGTTGAIYCSASSTKMLFTAGIINAIVTGLGIVLGILGGSIESVAIGVSIANWSNMMITFVILTRIVLKEAVWSYFKNFIMDISVMIVISAGVNVLFAFWNIQKVVIAFGCKVLGIGIVYFIYLLCSEKAVKEEIMKMIRKK